MEFLHESKLGYHGQMTASNCIVDSQWVVKLSEFGLLETFKKEVNDGALQIVHRNGSEQSIPPNNSQICVCRKFVMQCHYHQFRKVREI